MNLVMSKNKIEITIQHFALLPIPLMSSASEPSRLLLCLGDLHTYLLPTKGSDAVLKDQLQEKDISFLSSLKLFLLIGESITH